MKLDPFLEAYLKLCQQTCERLQREGAWPWPVDSQNSEDLVESEDTQNDV